MRGIITLGFPPATCCQSHPSNLSAPFLPPSPSAFPERSASPCVHVYPAVLALATNFVGYAAFARLLGDDKPELLQELDIKEVSEVAWR